MSTHVALSSVFPAYEEFETRVPVRCVTPNAPGTIHRFYDTSPFSPSGRYLAVTRLPSEHRRPRPGEIAHVLVVDLEAGTTNTVAETRGWDTQLGAQVQWGSDDRSLYFNDVDVRTWRPFGVRLDPLSGARTILDGTIYMISPDGRWSASPCLRRTAITQAGYGVVVPRRKIPVNHGAAEDDGIYLTNTTTGESRLLISIAQIANAAGVPLRDHKYERGDFYGFHVKWNPQGTRLLFVLRWLPRKWRPAWLGQASRQDGLKNVVTLDADGNNIRVAIPDAMWSNGGHHPNWCPDGEHVLMNLNVHGDGLRFVRAKFDGSTCETLVPQVRGSGHPTIHPSGTHLVTDAYLKESPSFGDGTVPIRWVNLHTLEETTLVRIRTKQPGNRPTGPLRVDPHPAWDTSFRRLAFNACPDGRRRVFVASLHELIGEHSSARAAA